MLVPAKLTLTTTAAFAVLVLSACGGGSSTSAPSVAPATVEWTTVQDVRDSLEADGLTCMESGVGPFVQEGKTLDGEVTDKWTEINCDDFDVILVLDAAAFGADSLATCTENEANFEEAREVLTSTPLVVSDRFLVIGTADGGGFPEDAQPQAFVDAFGGTEMIIADYYKSVGCDLPW
ncbi:MAG: hypothetical protein Q8M17_14830 [Actinomycetota bacterium]|nr:hypothetical protein [Actinomycetota bacterium]